MALMCQVPNEDEIQAGSGIMSECRKDLSASFAQSFIQSSLLQKKLLPVNSLSSTASEGAHLGSTNTLFRSSGLQRLFAGPLEHLSPLHNAARGMPCHCHISQIKSGTAFPKSIALLTSDW